jgi:hypothetical protein
MKKRDLQNSTTVEIGKAWESLRLQTSHKYVGPHWEDSDWDASKQNMLFKKSNLLYKARNRINKVVFRKEAHR